MEAADHHYRPTFAAATVVVAVELELAVAVAIAAVEVAADTDTGDSSLFDSASTLAHYSQLAQPDP